jgi:hypothetical protein
MTLSSGVGVVAYGISWRGCFGPGTLHGVSSFAVRVILASVLMGAFHTAWTSALAPFPFEGRRVAMALHLGGALCLDSAFFFAALRILRTAELRELLGALLVRRVRRGEGQAPE